MSVQQTITLCQKEKLIAEPWFPGLTLKTVLKWDFVLE
jgi:hypothetical protein